MLTLLTKNNFIIFEYQAIDHIFFTDTLILQHYLLLIVRYRLRGPREDPLGSEDFC